MNGCVIILTTTNYKMIQTQDNLINTITFLTYLMSCHIFLKLQTFYYVTLHFRQTTGWSLCLGESNKKRPMTPTSPTPASVILLSTTNYKTIMFT